MYKSKEIESTFTGLFNHKNSNMVIGCIYRHLKVPVTEFAGDYLVPLRKVIQREKRNNSNGGFQH